MTGYCGHCWHDASAHTRRGCRLCPCRARNRSGAPLDFTIAAIVLAWIVFLIAILPRVA